MNLTKAELADCLVSKMGFNRHTALDLVDDFFMEICAALERGDDVKLSQFGKFVIREKKARPGRNPRTGTEVTISERRVVKFRAGEKLKAKVKDHVGA